MFKPLLRIAAPFLLLAPVPLAAQPPAPIAAADMMRHIQVLASDQYQGRGPGTEGERLATAYIVEQLRARGLEPAGENGTWFQPVALVDRATRSEEVSWTAGGRACPSIRPISRSRGATPRPASPTRRSSSPAMARACPRAGIDQLAGADLHGAIVFILFEAPDVPGFPTFTERVRAVTDAGAAAVIGITGEDLAWRFVTENFRRPSTKYAGLPTAPVVGAMPLAAAQRLFAASGADLERLLNDQPGAVLPRGRAAVPRRPSRRHRRAQLHDQQRARPDPRLGRDRRERHVPRPLGPFRNLPAGRRADRICNGAVDNASGVAMLIEVAGRLAAGPRPVRDILVMATTAEEEGLLGAEYFARHPTVPLASIVAAINLDTVAVAPAGEPVAILNRSVPALNAQVEAAARELGRRMDVAHEADAMADRQDGWALASHGVPAVMVGGSFASMARLNAFLRAATTSRATRPTPASRWAARPRMPISWSRSAGALPIRPSTPARKGAPNEPRHSPRPDLRRRPADARPNPRCCRARPTRAPG